MVIVIPVVVGRISRVGVVIVVREGVGRGCDIVTTAWAPHVVEQSTNGAVQSHYELEVNVPS